MNTVPAHVETLKQSLVADLNEPGGWFTKTITAANLKFVSWDPHNRVTVFTLVGNSQQDTPLSGTVTYNATISQRYLDDSGVASLR